MLQQLAFSLIVISICWILFRKRPSNLPPGPTPLPIVGNLLNLKRDMMLLFKEMVERFGPVFGIRLGQRYAVIISGIDEILEAFQKKSTKTSDRHRPWMVEMLEKDTHIGFAFHDYDGFWRAQRKLTHQHILSPTRLNHFEPLILQEIEYLVKSIESQGKETFDISSLLRRTSLSIIASLVAGKHYEVNDPEFKQLEGVIIERTRSPFTVVDLFPFFKYLPIKFSSQQKAIEEQRDFVNSFFGKLLEEHKATFNPEITRDFIDVILLQRSKEERNEEESDAFADQNIPLLLFGLFIAGTDTTANTLLWMLIALCNKPSIQQKMQLEIDQVLQGKRATFEDKPKLNYINAVIKETTRWRAVAPLSLPHKNKEDVEVGGKTIPAGSIMIPNIWAVQMDEKFWKNPEEFNPERWLNATAQEEQHLIPFGVGIRECAGKHLAYRNLFLETVAMLQNFTFASEGEISTDGILGIIYSPHPFKLTATKRT